MASIRFGAGIVDARGSISGQTFSRNASGAYIRARVAPTNPATPAQTAARSSFGAISAAWAAIGAEARAAWNAAAASALGQQTNRLGEVIQLTGQQLYMSLSRTVAVFGADPPDSPPSPDEDMAALAFDASGSTVEVNTGGTGLETLDIDLDVLNEASESDVLFYATPPSSPGKSRPASGVYRLISPQFAVADGVATGLVTPYEATYGAVTDKSVGLVIWWRAVPANSATGETGAGITFSTVIGQAT